MGVMTIPVGIERGFITREQGAQRMATIVDFLLNKAERFHGAFSHWLNGTTGEAKAFSETDDGGDLVETALMMEGLLTVQQYSKFYFKKMKKTAMMRQKKVFVTEYRHFGKKLSGTGILTVRRHCSGIGRLTMAGT